MRSLVVVLLDERIEARLLLQDVRPGRLGRFLFQRQMHALVPAVLLRMPGCDAFDLDAESQPHIHKVMYTLHLVMFTFLAVAAVASAIDLVTWWLLGNSQLGAAARTALALSPLPGDLLLVVLAVRL